MPLAFPSLADLVARTALLPFSVPVGSYPELLSPQLTKMRCPLLSKAAESTKYQVQDITNMRCLAWSCWKKQLGRQHLGHIRVALLAVSNVVREKIGVFISYVYCTVSNTDMQTIDNMSVILVITQFSLALLLCIL